MDSRSDSLRVSPCTGPFPWGRSGGAAPRAVRMTLVVTRGGGNNFRLSSPLDRRILHLETRSTNKVTLFSCTSWLNTDLDGTSDSAYSSFEALRRVAVTPCEEKVSSIQLLVTQRPWAGGRAQGAQGSLRQQQGANARVSLSPYTSSAQCSAFWSRWTATR